MSYRRKLINNIVNPQIENIPKTIRGQIIKYDESKSCADVLCPSMDSEGGDRIYEGVPVCIYSNGFKSPPLKAGDYVDISFSNGSPFAPEVVALSGRKYDINSYKHIEQGTLNEEEEFIEWDIVPSSELWKDNDSETEKYKYYKKIDPEREAVTLDDLKGNYKEGDTGIINPVSKSVITIKNNGDIEIFAEDNTGIRINNSKKIIEFFGDNVAKSPKWVVLSDSIEINSDKIDIKCRKLNINDKDIKI